jgi:hypothetical protein
MPTPSTTIHSPEPTDDDSPTHRQGWLDAVRQCDRLWLLVILLMFTAVVLGGCHARSDCCHAHTSCGNSSADGVLAAFYVAYLLGWIIVTAAGG